MVFYMCEGSLLPLWQQAVEVRVRMAVTAVTAVRSETINLLHCQNYSHWLTSPHNATWLAAATLALLSGFNITVIIISIIDRASYL